jgi:hypothetical protein
MAEHADDTPATRVIELTVNLDDATGEQLGAAIDRLMQAGALDAWATPIVMKKGRPGHTLSVLATADTRDALARQLLEDTGSFGVRFRPSDRLVLDRRLVSRDTRLGPVTLKVGSLDGRPAVVKPEYADVLRLAERAGVSLHEAQRVAGAAADALIQALREGAERA